MVIDETEFNGWRPRMRQLKWYLELFNDGVDLKLDYGPLTHAEMEATMKAFPDVIDIDRAAGIAEK